MNWIIRGVLILWAAFFGLTGVQGLLSPTPYFELFGITGDATGVNTIRADLSAFFIVSAAGALVGALVPITQAMIAEALSVALMLGALRLLSAPASAARDEPSEASQPTPDS
jgi:hypothetical protein